MVRIIEGVKLPDSALTLRRLVTPGGATPNGSTSGWCHFSGIENGRALVADGGLIGRFWPADYDEGRDVWVAAAAGTQFRNGEIVEVFDL